MNRKIVYIVIVLVAFNLFSGFNVQRIPRWFKAQWDYYAGKYVSATQNYEKAKNGDKDSVMEFNEGASKYRDGDFKGAEESFTKAGEDDPEYADAPYNQGNARFKQGNLEGAVESYENALKIDPEHEDARHNLDYVKKLLEQKNNKADNTDSQDNQQNQNPQSSEKQGQDQSDQQQKENEGKNQQSDQQNSQQDQQQGQSGNEKQDQSQKDQQGSGGDQSMEKDQQPPEENNPKQNSSGLTEQQVKEILDALAQEERALAGQLDQNNNQDQELSDPFGIFNELWTLPEDMDPFATRKHRKQNKDEVDW